MTAGTLLSLSRNSHWFVRGWEFPRPLIAGIALASWAFYGALYFQGALWEWGFMLCVSACIVWHCYWVFPYTPFGPTVVDESTATDGASTISLVVSNVQQGNEEVERWLDVVQRADADVILALEVDDRWAECLAQLEPEYPHVVRQPQENCYGMMLLSRLPIIEPEVRFLVEDTVPAIEADIELESGDWIHLWGVHPRPPQPVKDQHTTDRDAEIMILAREINERENSTRTIVLGDFNDVAWSRTTDLFLQVSGLLDPRMGRGLYNTFHARYPLFRFPLDQIFHSSDFKIRALDILEYVGSDHFPVFAELSYDPEEAHKQPTPEASRAEKQEAHDKVEKAEEEGGNDLHSATTPG